MSEPGYESSGYERSMDTKRLDTGTVPSWRIPSDNNNYSPRGEANHPTNRTEKAIVKLANASGRNNSLGIKPKKAAQILLLDHHY